MPFDTVADPTPLSPRLGRPGTGTCIIRGLQRRCPACGMGNLFCGFLTVQPVCAVCGNDNGAYPSDDFAPYVTIFLVLHLMTPFLIGADALWTPPFWLEGLIALPIFTAATISLLPYAKGGVIGFAYAMGVRRRSADQDRLG